MVLHEQQLFDLATDAQAGSLDAAEDPIYSAAFADADGDGTLEIASQGSLFDASGRVLWTIPDAPGRTYSVALQADDDALPEFLFLERGWWLVDSDGSELVTVPAFSDGTGLVLADFDGDGAPDIVTWNGEATAVYHLDGTLLWEAADWGGQPFGWDFDADGASELVVIGDGVLRILDGRTGAVLYELEIVVSGYSFPLVADIDGDGHAELIIPGGTPRDGDTPQLTVLHQVNDTWPAAGPSWPVRDFQISNVGPAGEIPRGETNPPWWAYNTYHARPAADPAGVNLTPAVVATCADTCTGMTQLEVQVTNSGPAASGAAVVQLQRNGAALGEATVDAVEPGWTSAGVMLSLPTADVEAGGVTVVVDPAGLVEECHEDDNEVGVGSGT